MNVVIYARYSSDKQTEQSIEGQIKVCTNFANFNGYNIIDTYIDRAMTGKNDDRPGLQKLIADSNRKLFQGVLVYAMDRFGRNLQQSVNNEFRLKRNGVKLISATENFTDDSSGQLHRNIMMSFAQYYSDELSAKVKRGMVINAERCQFNGGTIPLGYKSVDKRLVVDEETAPIVQKIFEMYADGSRAVDIADYLNARQIRTASGAMFNKNSLHSILKNKKYIGVYKYADVVVENAVPRIISDELFNRVAEVLERNKKHAGHNKAKVEYLLTTKLFCGHCRAPMVGVSARSKTGRIYYYYSCNNARLKICDKKNARKEKIEDLVIKKCRELLTDENIAKIAKAVSVATDKAQDKTEEQYLKRKLKEIDKAIENLMRALETGQNVDLISERITAKRKERSDIERDLAVEVKKSVTLTEPEIRFFLTALKSGDVNDMKYRRTLITIFVNSVYLFDDRMTIIFNAGDEPAIVDNILLDELESDSEDAKGLYSARFGSPKKQQMPLGICCFFDDPRDSNNLNATVRWTVAAEGLTEANLNFCPSHGRAKMQTNLQRGSDGSAASGGRSDLSEWQRSTAEEGAPSPTMMSGTATGHIAESYTPSLKETDLPVHGQARSVHVLHFNWISGSRQHSK